MVDFRNFQTMPPAERDVIFQLLDLAGQQASDFMSFSASWMAFNGWMACVTGEEYDAGMVQALSDDRKLAGAFDDIRRINRGFAELLEEYCLLWPVWNVADIRKKLGHKAFYENTREELVAKCLAAKVKHRPLEWDGIFPPTWAQTLAVIYQVRCNLFHGVKSPENGRDQYLVRLSDRVLRRFLEESRCFEWDGR